MIEYKIKWCFLCLLIHAILNKLGMYIIDKCYLIYYACRSTWALNLYYLFCFMHNAVTVSLKRCVVLYDQLS